MLPRSRTIILLICLFLIAFKVAASSIFIQAAIERVELASGYNHQVISQQAHDSNSSADDKEQVHSMYLMNHVTANISEMAIAVFLPLPTLTKIVVVNKILFTQNFPDTAFKPPKV